jgi:hypothetical protein
MMRDDDEIGKELQFHDDSRIDDLIAAGVSRTWRAGKRAWSSAA